MSARVPAAYRRMTFGSREMLARLGAHLEHELAARRWQRAERIACIAADIIGRGAWPIVGAYACGHLSRALRDGEDLPDDEVSDADRDRKRDVVASFMRAASWAADLQRAIRAREIDAADRWEDEDARYRCAEGDGRSA